MPLILRGFTALLQRQIEIAARGSTLIPQRNFAAANALWEALTAAPALGAQLPYILPHDHGPEGGGGALPRGCIYSFDVGDEETAYHVVYAGVTGWANMITRTKYTFPAWVSPGIDSGSTNVSGGTCYLIAKICARATLGGAEIRLANKTNGNTNNSSAVAVGTTISWLTISDVYAYGGRWNEFDIQSQQTTAVANNVYVYAVSLHEIRATSQPASAGAYTYSSVPRPT